MAPPDPTLDALIIHAPQESRTRRKNAFSKTAVRVFHFQETNWAPGTVPHGVTFAPVRNTQRPVPPKKFK
ncbi:hypothetical protein E4U31_004047 [Claviceps sp. LM219 group G6]|nr:hypothetical protein E4U31_004047 [Claviceps sp. LM219 group G6]